ncbi:MAG: peptide deformylase [Dehalococcoidia bacterium]|nr:peptide deformylase [Dehalococcoidia bacterium]
MAILAIRPASDPLVHKKSKRVTGIDKSICRLLDDMVETMRVAGGVGLAAPQVGVLLRVIVIETPDEGIIELINPVVIKASGERDVEEGCLCLPGYIGQIKRSEVVKVKGLDREGREVRIKADDLLAEALEHEIDHLNGILFVDHLESMDKLRKLEPASAAGEAGAAE